MSLLSLFRGASGMKKRTMDKLLYSVTGPSFNNEYGIAVVDRTTQHNAVTTQFLKKEEDAKYLVMRLNEEQMPISVFCKAFSIGVLMDIL